MHSEAYSLKVHLKSSEHSYGFWHQLCIVTVTFKLLPAVSMLCLVLVDLGN